MQVLSCRLTSDPHHLNHVPSHVLDHRFLSLNPGITYDSGRLRLCRIHDRLGGAHSTCWAETGSPITNLSNSSPTGRTAIIHAPPIRAARLSPVPDFRQPEAPAVAAAECACLPSIETWVANSPPLRVPDGGYYGGGIEQPYEVGEYCCLFCDAWGAPVGKEP